MSVSQWLCWNQNSLCISLKGVEVLGPPSAKNQYHGLVYGSVSKRFENVHNGPTLAAPTLVGMSYCLCSSSFLYSHKTMRSLWFGREPVELHPVMRIYCLWWLQLDHHCISQLSSLLTLAPSLPTSMPICHPLPQSPPSRWIPAASKHGPWTAPSLLSIWWTWSTVIEQWTDSFSEPVCMLNQLINQWNNWSVLWFQS